MRLYIAEKPSMALEIAKVLFNTSNPQKSADGYFYGAGDDKVTWLFGHILELAEPVDYNKNWKDWSLDTLPIIPAKWRRLVKYSAEKHFTKVQTLIGEASEIIHAGDPDREGQLLVDEVLEYVKNESPVKRLLLNALDTQSVKKAISSLYDNDKFIGLKTSAEVRSKLDWLIGMNATRAITVKAKGSGYNRTFSIGRVKTPTLILVVKREEEIKNFKSIDYFDVSISCHTDIFFLAKLITAKLPPDKQSALDEEGRLIDQAIANIIAAEVEHSGKTATFVNGQTDEKSESPPLPYSLSALQIQASKQYSFKAQKALDICQGLYEKKLITYPRSDCSYLPTSQFPDRQAILKNLREMQKPFSIWVAAADNTLKNRVWNDEKISAHHAIIPSLLACDMAELNSDEQKIYTLIAQNYIAQFYPAHRYEAIQSEITAAGYSFAVSGRKVLSEGWKVLYGKDEEKKEEATVPKLTGKSSISVKKVLVSKEKTTAPTRYTEGTLLSAMKNIHRHVRDTELRDILKETGIGTEATRAGILKSLVDENYLYEEGKKKYLVPTQEAYLLYKALPAQLIYPDYTAMMERELELIAENKLAGDVVLEKDEQNIRNLCELLKNLAFQTPENRVCPVCGAVLVQRSDAKNKKFWGCSKYPDCKKTFPDKNGEPDFTTKETIPCPVCQKGNLRFNSKLKFWGCSGYPDCKATFLDKNGEPQIVLCPQCKKGYLRRSRDKDKKQWYCSGYRDGCKAVYDDVKGRPKLTP
jgi:DNA topoisomerase-3